MNIQLSMQESGNIEAFIERSKANSAQLQQLALDASQVLGCTEQRLTKQQNMGGLKRFWYTITGEAKQDSLANTGDLIKAQQYAMYYLNVLQQNQLMLASTLMAVQNNLNQLAMDLAETKGLIAQMADAIGQKFTELEQRTERLEVHSSIHTWLNIIEDEDYLPELSPRLRFLTVLKQFYLQKASGDWNISELKLFRTALRKVGLDHKQSIQLGQFVAELVQELQAPGQIQSYEELLSLQTTEGQEIGMEYLRDNISMPSLLALKQLPDSFQRLQPAVEVLQENLDMAPLQALTQVIHKDISETYFIDLDHQLSLFELGVQLLSGFSLATNLLQQRKELEEQQRQSEQERQRLIEQKLAEERQRQQKKAEEDKATLDQWLRDNDFANINDQIYTVIFTFDGEEIEEDGVTPLHMASTTGATEIAKLLLEKGADINAKTNKGITPLHCAAFKGQTEVARLLVQAGANINAQDNEESIALLHFAFLQGQTEVAKLLVEAGADIHVDTEDGITYLHLAVGLGHTELAKLLVEKGADVNAIDNEEGKTPLHITAEEGKKEVTKLLVEKGADVNAKNNDGETPLHIAAKEGKTEIAKLLVQAGANVNAKDNNSWTPLDLAHQQGKTKVARYLHSKRFIFNRIWYILMKVARYLRSKRFIFSRIWYILMKVARYLRSKGARRG